MKKNFKLLSLALSLVVALSSSTSAFAAETVNNISVAETPATTYGNPIIDGAIALKTIYDNSTFTFHHSNHGYQFYARKGTIHIEVKSSAAAEYSNCPLVIHLADSAWSVISRGEYHKATDSWTFVYDVPRNGNYCFYYCNEGPSGEYYNFAQTITITATNIYSLAN